MFTPSQSIEALELLGKAIEGPLSILCEFDALNASQLHFEYDPRQFTKFEKLRLLRANLKLQHHLEQLSHIIEYTPYIFRLYNVNEYS